MSGIGHCAEVRDCAMTRLSGEVPPQRCQGGTCRSIARWQAPARQGALERRVTLRLPLRRSHPLSLHAACLHQGTV